MAQQALAAAEGIGSDVWRAQALAQVGEVDGLRRALAAAEGIGNDRLRAEALIVVAAVLAQAGKVDGLQQVLAAAEGIGDKYYRAEVLSEVVQALAQIEQPDRALAVFVKAFRTARFGGRDSVFSVLGQAAPALAGIEHGLVLRQVYDQVMEAESWWGA